MMIFIITELIVAGLLGVAMITTELLISDDRTHLGCKLIITVVSLFALILLYIMPERAYKQGQIDAISKSKIQYKLTTKPDSTKVWEKIPNYENLFYIGNGRKK